MVCAVIIHVFVFYLHVQDRALFYASYHGNVVRAQELLSLGANINYYHDEWVSYSAHITHYIVGVSGINTLY